MRTSLVVLFSTLLLVLTGPGELRAQFADSITVTELADDLYLFEGALDLIVVSTGPDGTLMVDAGYPGTEEMVREALAKIGAGPPDLLVNTHWHHTFANAAFGGDAVVVAHRTVLERSRRAQRMFRRVVPPLPPHARPEVVVDDSLTLRFNGREIRLVHLPNAHTDGDLAVTFPEAGVVMTGDAAVAHLPWTDPDAGGRFDALVAAAERLRASVPSDAVVVPGHGRPFGRDTLELYARLVRETADRVRDRIARGWSLARVVEEGVGERWRTWEAAVPESLFLASAYRAYGPEDRSAPPPPVRFEGGRWWDGTRFREGTWYAVGGRLTRSAPVEPDSAVELDGGYVLPGFGEAHTHRLGDPDRLAEDHEALLEAGVYYAMVQDPAHEVSDRMRALAASTEGVDAVYTQGVITPSRGVIPIFYRMMVEARGTEEDGEGRLYFTVDDAAELDAKWPAIEAQNDAFVKVILAFSDEHARRSADRERYDARPPRYSALPGLDPSLLPDLVRRARGAGLRVSVHVETAADVRVAADAGVDVIAHLPASWQIGPETGISEAERGRWLLSEADARAVARSGAVVVTTALPPPGREDEAAFAEVHRHNLAALRGAGARLAIGSDAFRGTVLDEVAYLEGLGVFERAELLRLLTRDTPRMIFPGRRLGALEEGAEADFVVLEADPTTDLSALWEVRLRVKDGRVLATRTDEPSADRDTIPTTGAAVPELAAFDRAVRSLMSVHGLPGASLAVARDERLVLARAYGHADTVGRERMRPNHRFRIASVSKPVTAAAVLKLVEDGELRLGDRAFAFLDQLEPPAGATVDPRFREITIRQLLRHRAGFDCTRGLDPTLTPGRVAAELGVGLPVEVEQVISFMLGRPLDVDPGTKTVYSNFGYAVLGRVVERVTGRDYEAYVREANLRPAGATGMELGQAFPTDRPADEVSYYHPPPPRTGAGDPAR